MDGVWSALMLGRAITFLLLLALPGMVKATTFLTFQSTYLGDGWFKYQMTVLNDPFFTQAVASPIFIGFTNQIDSRTESTNLFNDSFSADYAYSSWSLTNGYSVRPYFETFFIRSSETSFRLGSITNSGVTLAGGFVGLDLNFANYCPASVSSGASGFTRFACLQPCRPEEADGSPTNCLYVVKLLPDVALKQLIQTNGSIYGVDFTWDYASTFVLQGTSNFNNWTNIAYVWSYPPETIWTTNIPLNNYGQFFRVQLVADGHTTNLPSSMLPLLASTPQFTANIAKANLVATTPNVTGCRFNQGKITVNLAAQSGQSVLIQAIDARGKVLQTRQISMQTDAAIVMFDANSLPSVVYFKANLNQ